MSDDPALLFYLIILFVGVGSILFGEYRSPLSQALRHAATWLLIFLGAVTLYGFKDTLQSQLFPQSVAVLVGSEIVLTRARDGHFYANLNINDVEVNFVVDTGATGVVINRDDARRIGIKDEDLVFFGRAQTANGMVETAPVWLETVEFAGRLDRGLRASVNGGDLGTSLLGMSYLSKFSKIEIAGNQMRLVP